MSLKLRLLTFLFLVLVLAGCGQVKDLLRFGPAATPTPSPKPKVLGANRLAYLQEDGSFWLIRPDGKEKQLLFQDDSLVGRQDFHFDWSPDASKIITDGLRLINLETGEMKQLPLGETPKWSPAGDRIIFSGIGFDSRNLYLMKLEGTSSKLVDKNVILDWGVNHSRNWSPKGDRFIYTKITEAGETEIWVADADGQNRKRVFDPDQFGITDIRSPTWAPKGDRIAFTFRAVFDPEMSDTDNLATVKVDGSGLIVLTNYIEPDQSVIFPVWSPDNETIVWVAVSDDENRGGVWLIYLKKSKIRRLYKNSPALSATATPVTWSRDSKRLMAKVLPDESLVSPQFSLPEGLVDITNQMRIKCSSRRQGRPDRSMTDRDLGTYWQAGKANPNYCDFTLPDKGRLPMGLGQVVMVVKKDPGENPFNVNLIAAKTKVGEFKGKQVADFTRITIPIGGSGTWNKLRLYWSGGGFRASIREISIQVPISYAREFLNVSSSPYPGEGTGSLVALIYRDPKRVPSIQYGKVTSMQWSPK